MRAGFLFLLGSMGAQAFTTTTGSGIALGRSTSDLYADATGGKLGVSTGQNELGIKPVDLIATSTSGSIQQHKAPSTSISPKFGISADQDKRDINRADHYSTWTPADYRQYTPPTQVEYRQYKQFSPTPRQPYGTATMMGQTEDDMRDQIGALGTKPPIFLNGESKGKGDPIETDPRFGPRYPAWIQSC